MGDSMSTIINATTTNGVVIQPDNSGSLVLQTNSGTTALTISTAQDTTLAGKLTTASSGIQFSDASTQTAAASPYVLKNRIINGDMRIDQRRAGASVTPTSDDTYTLDRWIARLSQSSKYSAQQVSDAPNEFINSIKITSLSSYSVTSSDYFQIGQYVEGLNAQDLMWGTANAKTVTLSFWVKSSLTGTFGGTIFGYQTGTPSYPFSYTILAANTWEQKTVTITGPTSGTFNTNNSGCFTVLFSFGVGSSLSGTANTWNYSTLYRAPTGATSVVGTNGATFYITGVQLEQNTSATPFERRMYNQELANCQRYCEVIKPTGAVTYAQIAVGQCEASTSGTVGYFYQVAKRAAPTVTYDTASKYVVTASGGGATTVTSISTARADTTSLAIGFGVASGLTGGNATRLLDNNTNNPLTIISSEL
jgi:hypothetical protein